MKKTVCILPGLILSLAFLGILVSCAGDPAVKEDDLHQPVREYTSEEKEVISHIPPLSEEHSLLSPKSPYRLFEGGDVVLNFGEKKKISETKFGFRKKIVFEQSVILCQYMQDDMNFIYYGLYRDKELEKPVVEVDTYYNLQAFGMMEEGADASEFPEYMEGYTMKVEPGTYYLGVYTREPDLNASLLYLCESVPLEEEIALTSGKNSKYMLIDEADSVLCKITPSSKRIQVTGDAGAGMLQLLDSEKNSVSDVIKPEKGTCTPTEFSVKPGKTYYLKVQHSAVHDSDSTSGLGFWNIRYENID